MQLKSHAIDLDSLKDKTHRCNQSIQDLFMLKKADAPVRAPVQQNLTGDINEGVMQMIQDLEDELKLKQNKMDSIQTRDDLLDKIA
jgi:hypothetical protein